MAKKLDLTPALLAVQTVFFGGGTPSLLEIHHVQAILDAVRTCFRLDPAAEITLEANPESLTLDKARGWRAAGVNRISMGLQTADNTLLKKIDRLHTFEDFLRAYRDAREAGFSSISADLIYGLPSQTVADWQQTLDAVLPLGLDHISLYALAVEANTPFAVQKITTNSDLQAEMYAMALDRLPKAGLAQYEISNFAKPGHECRHNLIYWRQQDYYAVGAGAVGCVGNERWTNQKTLHAYEQDLQGDRLPRQSVETLSDAERRFERLMLGLRLREGLAWGDEPNPVWKRERERLLHEGLLEKTEADRWRIPASSIALTNQVLLPFL